MQGDKMKFFTMCTFAGEENIKEQKKVFLHQADQSSKQRRGGWARVGECTKEKHCKHEPAVIHIMYSGVIHGAATLFYISIVPLRE